MTDQTPIVGDTIADAAAVAVALRAWELEIRHANDLAARLDKIRAVLAASNLSAAERVKRLCKLLDEV